MVKKRASRSTKIDLLRIAHFILLNTLIFQEVLSNQWTQVRSLRSIKGNLQDEFLVEWERIEKGINFGPIFKLARQVLGALPTGPSTEEGLRELRKLALSVVASGAQLRHDLMGRIYHKLLLQTMGGYYATYYTSVPAAVLLSDLLIKTDNPSWDFSSLDRIKNLRIIDPACGSGTLVAAAYAALRDRFILTSPAPTAADLAELHRVFMEEGLYGFDVLDYAAHLTLTTLAMQNPRSKFRGSKVRTLNNGVAADGRVFLGSLDYLDSQATFPAKSWGESPTESRMEQEDVFRKPLPPGSFDCVIMNPPFSRGANPNLAFGYAPPVVRAKMRSRLSELTRKLGLEGIGVAGLGSHFVVLGDKLLKKGGRIGIVVPRQILSGVSWEKIRDILTRKYAVEYILSNFDPEPPPGEKNGWCWSENTDLGEVLIVARKTNGDGTPVDCLYVNVLRRPRTEVESLLLSQDIRRQKGELPGSLTEGYYTEIKTGSGKVSAYAYRVKPANMARNWHYACLFSNPAIIKATLGLSENPSLVSLGSYLASKGRDIAWVKGNFARSAGQTPFPIVYGHQGAMNSIDLGGKFIGFGRPTGGTKAEETFRALSSDLLIAERPHLNTECILAAEVDRPVLTTAFWEVKLKDPTLRQLLLLWLNSTVGFLAALAAGGNSQGEIFKIKQDHLDDILIPRPTPSLCRAASTLYETVRTKPLQPFPKEFDLARQGKGTRLEIDRFLTRTVDLGIEISELYPLIAQEPSVTLERATLPSRAGLEGWAAADTAAKATLAR